MPLRKGRAARHTILLVGEGTTDSAFLKHIKSLYISRGCGVCARICNAHGKGPDRVVGYAIRQRQNAAYDRVVTLLDTDLEMSTAARRQARSKKDTDYRNNTMSRGSVAKNSWGTCTGHECRV